MDDLIRDLQSLGFNKKEAAIYIAVLELGSAGAVEISKRSLIHRATVYTVLDSLAQKGLVSVFTQGGDRRYLAEAPERILTLLDMQLQELDVRRRLANNMLLRLKVFHNLAARKPKIRYIEKLDGMRAMQKEYEQMDDDIIQIVGYDTFLQLHDPGISHIHQKQLSVRKRKIRSILVTDRSVNFSDDLDIEYVTISPSLLDVHGEMSVCGDKLVLFSYSGGIIAIEIHSKAIADTARATLELAWREAKKWGTGGNVACDVDENRNIG
ncbi:MAG: helix-turn-helix domain-containing protein [Candidatus Uhrbacteria bacterium]|nr:helix-turn-helix domain-containing protein [Candidatus Uhrbacteria bacterium]